jgi:hypothetical protein
MIEWSQLEKALCDIWTVINQVVLELRKRSATVEKVLADEAVIPVNTWNGSTGNKGNFESTPVQNEGYCCGRLLIDAAFDDAATGGLTVDLYYKSQKIGEVIKIPYSMQVTGGVSAALDLANLSGFHFIVVNHDPVHAVTIKHFRIVLWGVK